MDVSRPKEDEGQVVLLKGGFLRKLRGISLVEKLMFTRNLAVMIGAGLPLTRALTILAGQTQSEKFGNVLLAVCSDLSKGVGLGDSFAKFPYVFNDLFVNMIRVGEIGGTLEGTLKLLGEQMKKDHDLRSKVKGAMIYPSVVVSAMMLVGVLMMIFVVPTLAETFRDIGIELPFSTRLVIGASDFLVAYWYIALLGLIGFIFMVRAYFRTPQGKHAMDYILMRTPIFKGITTKLNTAAFARTLSSLIDAGVSIVKSLEITANTLGNHYFKDAIQGSMLLVEKGKTLRETLEPHQDVFPVMVIQMIAVGEETGKLSGVLRQLATFYEEEVDNATKNLSSVLEPVIMVFLGAFIGFFAISMISPMYSLSGSI